MSLADDFLSLDREQANLALSKMTSDQKTRLQTLLSEKNKTVSDIKAKTKATPFLTDAGDLLSDFFTKDIPKGLKSAAEIYVQFGAGMVDALDDIGTLIGAPPPSESARPTEAKGLIQKGTRFTGSFFAPGGLGTKSGMVVNNALKTPSVMAKAQRVANLVKPIAEQTGKSVAFVGEMLSSVPREMLEKAIKTPEILNRPFKGSETYREIGEKAQSALNWVTKQAGKAVKAETEALKDVDTLIDASKYAQGLTDLVEGTVRGRVDQLATNKKGKRIVTQIRDQLLDLATDPDMEGMVTPSELHGVKKQIDNLVKFGSETVSQLGDVGEGILKQIRKEINKDLRKIGDYAAVNDEFSKIADLKNSLRTRLKDKTLAGNMKSMILKTDPYEPGLLKELDRIAPDGMKFYNDLDIAVINDAFGELFPGRGGGSGGTQGVANILRSALGFKTGGLSLLGSSPMAQKQLIKRFPKEGAKKIFNQSRKAKRVAPFGLLKAAAATKEEN